MGRLPDWNNRLVSYLAKVRQRPFKYGRHDCALFCAGAVKAMTGQDLAKPFGTYRKRADGIAQLTAAGFDDHVAFVADKFIEVPPLMAQIGDIAVIEDATLGIVQGRSIYVVSHQGLSLVPLSAAERAFRV